MLTLHYRSIEGASQIFNCSRLYTPNRHKDAARLKNFTMDFAVYVAIPKNSNIVTYDRRFSEAAGTSYRRVAAR